MMMESDVRRPGRKRCEGTQQAILQAAYELLDEGGIGKFTIEGVAARSGAAKTTIYRWWPTKGKLAAEAFLASTETTAMVPETDSAVADLKAHMRLLAAIFRGRVGRIIAGLIAEGHTDPTTAAAYREGIIERRNKISRAIIQRGMDQGELRPDIDVEVALDALYSPFYTQLLMRFGTLDDDYIERLADTVLRGIALPTD
ncbi:MAG TPA: TetR/AcrR family transcriptional regulator C-terminal ligand-binding domain-containing protein [Aliidongia sp.]|nr:TetR/AcrR family transcriptional regulator C-terminal ligand-binding domain-containing protein [Aliidongia sp.]